MIPANPVNPLSTLIPAESGTRARPGLPPSAERLRELEEAVRSGAYAVSPDIVAAAMLQSVGSRAA
jgi:anti-sigma28 factor (negative regulator of flagellin synthesis)